MLSRLKIGVVPLIVLLAATCALLYNWPVFLHLKAILSQLPSVKIGFVISLPIFLIAALNAVFLPFSGRYLLKPFFTLILLTSSMVSYSMLNYGVNFDRDMIQNIVETNVGEATSYLNSSVALWVLLTGILPTLVLWSLKIQYHPKWYVGWGKRALSMLASLAVIAMIGTLYYQDYASVGRNNSTLNKEIVPTTHLYNGVKYLNHRFFSKPMPFQRIGQDATRTKGEKPTLIFLVLGETARSKNFSLNGYPKPTNAFTQQESNLIHFQHVQSCGTATAISVPCMFSQLTRRDYKEQIAKNSEGILDVLQKTGVSVLWKENDGGCKGVCARVPTKQINPSDYPQWCKGLSCFDEVLLEDLDQEVMNTSGDKLIGFHLMGSHGPTYYQRYPKQHRQFQPDCPRSDIENCNQQELENTYDNTIRYTDYVLSQMIAKLKSYQDRYNTALIYVSDHGESLGELGLYLHGTPYKVAPKEQTEIPMQIWMPTNFAQAKGVKIECLRERAEKTQFSHDNLFSSLLGIWDIKSSVYNTDLDLFKPCRS